MIDKTIENKTLKEILKNLEASDLTKFAKIGAEVLNQNPELILMIEAQSQTDAPTFVRETVTIMLLGYLVERITTVEKQANALAALIADIPTPQPEKSV